MAESTSAVVPISGQLQENSQKKFSRSQGKRQNSKSRQQSSKKQTSQSTKSASDSRSLTRTLRRKPRFWEFGPEDRKFLYAAYKQKAFGEFTNSGPREFDKQLDDYLALHEIAFIVESKTKEGQIPVGMIVGKFMGPILFLGDTTWFPWASSRNKMETITHLLNELRKRYIVMFFCEQKDKEFYLNIAKQGIIRRLGTIYDLFVDGGAPLFQTRRP